MLDELINVVSSKSGLSADQTRAGLGIVLRFAQEKMGAKFSQVQSLLPGVDALITAAPQAGGLGALASGLLGSFGGTSKLAGLATLVGAAEKAGISESQLMNLAQQAVAFVEQKHPEIGGILKSAVHV